MIERLLYLGLKKTKLDAIKTENNDGELRKNGLYGFYYWYCGFG